MAYDEAVIDLTDEMESFIDARGVSELLDAIVVICQEKASHVRENWQDEALGKQWDEAAKAIGRVANRSYPL